MLLAIVATTMCGGEVEARLRLFESVRHVRAHAELLRATAHESGVDAYLLAAVMFCESSGRVGARSSAGALGLFQLMPPTAAERAGKLGLPPPTDEQLLTDGALNARLGANYLAYLIASAEGDVERALVAYNAGPGRLERWSTEAGGYAAWRDQRPHTKRGALAYARKVLRYRDHYQGLRLFEPDAAPAS